MINVNNFKPGVSFKDGKDIFVVLEAQHSQQGRGIANVKTKLKNLRTGAIITMTYTGGDKVEPAVVEKREMNYLYHDGTSIVLMDNATYEQIELSDSKIGNAKDFLVENTKVTVRFYETEVLGLDLPASVALTVTQAPDAVRGNSVSSPTKRVQLETGIEVDAPMFIKQGEKVLVSTETGKYLSRA